MILYEDNHLLIVNKLPGDLVQGDQTGDQTLVDLYKDYIKKKYNKPGNVYLHPVHRLDRPVGGCLILGRTSKATSRLTTAFREKKVRKIYYSLSDQSPPNREDRLTSYLMKDPKKNKSGIVGKSNPRARHSVLQYRLISSQEGLHLFRIEPVTGRSHQIRVQFQSIGCPIVGDLKYGGMKTEENRMIYLHCAQLEFVHPTQQTKMIISCLPHGGLYWKRFKEFMNSERSTS